MKTIVIPGLIIVPSVVGLAAEVDLGSHGILSFAVLDTWTVNSNPAKGADGSPVGFAFAFKPRSQANAKCLLTLAYTLRKRSWTRSTFGDKCCALPKGL